MEQAAESKIRAEHRKPREEFGSALNSLIRVIPAGSPWAIRIRGATRSFLELSLGSDRSRRARLERSLFAIQLYIGGDWLGQYALAHWNVAVGPVRAYQSLSTVVSIITFALLRTGWSERLADPSMALYQIVTAQSLAAFCYIIFPLVRGTLLALRIGSNAWARRDRRLFGGSF